MKKTLLFLLTFSSLSVFGFADYTCRLRQYRIELSIDDRSTHLWLFNGYELIGHNYVGWIETIKTKTTFHFYLSNGDPVKLIFENEDIASSPRDIRGWIDGRANGWSLWDSINCRRRD